MKSITNTQRSLFGLLTLALVAILASCGGGSGGGGAAIGGQIVFPASGMNFEDTTITVYGQGSAGASAVMVNGIPATSADGFATWRAPQVLVPGKNTIQVEVIAGGTSRMLESMVVHQGPEILGMTGSSDVHGSLLVVYDGLKHQVARIDLADGSRKVIPLGTAIQPSPFRQVAYDWVRDRALLLGDELHAINFGDGVMTQLPLPSTPSAPVSSIAYDAPNDACYLLTYANIINAIPGRVDLLRTLTGALSVHSDFSGAATDPDRFLTGLDFDATSGRLFAWAADTEALFEIHPDGSRGVISDPGLGSTQVFGNPRGLTVLEGGGSVVVQEDAWTMVVIDTQSGNRSTQTFGIAPGRTMAASDGQGRILLGDIPDQSQPRGLAALDVLTLARESFFAVAPAQLPVGYLYALDFDETRAELVVGGAGFLCRIDPRTGASTGQIGQFPSSGYSSVWTLFVDEGRDRILIDYRNPDPLAQNGLHEFDAQGGNPNLLVPHVVMGSNPSLFRKFFARDETTGALFDFSYVHPLPLGPFDLHLDLRDPDGVALGQIIIPFPAAGFSAPIHEPTSDRLFFAAAGAGTSADVRSIDPATGTIQLVSAAGTDGIDLFPTDAHALLPDTGEIAFADGTKVVAVHRLTGARRLICDLGTRFGVWQSRALARDPRNGLLHVTTFGSFSGILTVDPITGSVAQLAR